MSSTLFSAFIICLRLRGAQVFCKDCGAEGANKDSFCGSCGSLLIQTSESSRNGADASQLSASSRPEFSAPGRGLSLGLGIGALLTVIVPILSLPCSITGFVIARKARNLERLELGAASSLASAGYFLCLACMIATTAIIVINLPQILQRNFG